MRPTNAFDYTQLDYYRKMLNFEEMSRLLYLKKAADAEREKARKLFLSLAGERRKTTTGRILVGGSFGRR